jgi:hypothetical protein
MDFLGLSGIRTIGIPANISMDELGQILPSINGVVLPQGNGSEELYKSKEYYELVK